MAAKLPLSARLGEFTQKHPEEMAKVARLWRAQQLADEEQIVRWVTASAKEALKRLGDDEDEKRREAITFYLEEFEALANGTHREAVLGGAEPRSP